MTAPFLWILVRAWFCLCSPWIESLFPSSMEIIIKSCWPSGSDSLRIPIPFVQNLYNSGRISLVLLFSSLWVTHPVCMEFVFIVSVPLLLSHSVFFVFWCRAFFFFFFGGSNILLLEVVQQLVVIFVLFQEEMNTCAFNPSSRNRRPSLEVIILINCDLQTLGLS